jgi:hypothetical protein
MDFKQEFIRVYRLEIQSFMLVFSTQLCALLPLSPSLPSSAGVSPCISLKIKKRHYEYHMIPFPFSMVQPTPFPPPLPYVKKQNCIHVYSVLRWGYGVLGLRQINTCCKVPVHLYR